MEISSSGMLAAAVALFALTQSSAYGSPVPAPKPLVPAAVLSNGIPVPHKRPVAAGIGRAAQQDDAPSEPVTPEPCEVEDAVYDLLPPLEGENGCGFSDQILLKEVGNETKVTLRPHVRISCRLAAKITSWLAKDVAGAADEILGSELEAIRTGPGYACRRRNNKPDGKLSEHALGTALDVAAFALADGRTVSVEEHWSGESDESRFLKSIHKSACDRFTTVLGPEADIYHQNHFHLDIGCHGKTCTYLICQ